MIANLFLRFEQALQSSARASAGSMVFVAAVGAIIFSFYGVLWLYITPLEHESLGLRMIAILFCLGLWLSPRWPEKYKKYLSWYWFAAVSYTLPFFSTYQLLGSNYSTLRSMVEVATVFFVIVMFPHYMLAIVNMAAGIGIAIVAAYFTVPNFGSLNHSIVKSVHIQAMVYTIVAGLLFTRSNLKGMLAQGKVETLTALAGSIAHEMRNPLGQIQYSLDAVGRTLSDRMPGASTQALQRQQLDELDRWLKQGRTAVKRGLQAIDMILNEIKSKAIDTTKFTVLGAAEIAQKAVDEFGYKSDTLRHRVKLIVIQDFAFKGEETLSLFVLYNLIKNALYYFPLVPEAQLTLTVERHCIRVKDTGPGIAAEVLPKLFESFYTSGKSEGTGLGLSFCKRTMRAFDGDITCDSVLGQYTEFTLSFPPLAPSEIDVAPSALAPAVESAEVEGTAALARLTEVATSSEITLKGKTILVAEDDEMNRDMLQLTLEAAGMQVLQAGHGEAAIAQLEAHPDIDLVLMDLDMPGMGGAEATMTIRRQPRAYQKVPIIVLSGNVDTGNIEVSLAGQIDDFLIKSGNMGLLQQKMLEVLKRGAPHQL